MHVKHQVFLVVPLTSPFNWSDRCIGLALLCVVQIGVRENIQSGVVNAAYDRDFSLTHREKDTLTKRVHLVISWLHQSPTLVSKRSSLLQASRIEPLDRVVVNPIAKAKPVTAPKDVDSVT